MRRLLPAAIVAGVLSGAPSTLHAIVTGRSVLTSVRAAGELLGRATIVRGLVAHVLVTIGWTTVLANVLPRRSAVVWGAVAGGAIARLDLALADRHWPAISALPRAPQVADHVLFGALVGAVAHR